jgi:hypothetical protein
VEYTARIEELGGMAALADAVDSRRAATELHYLLLAEKEVIGADYALARARDASSAKSVAWLKSAGRGLLAKLPPCIEFGCGERATLQKVLDNGSYYACSSHALPDSDPVPWALEANTLSILVRD